MTLVLIREHFVNHWRGLEDYSNDEWWLVDSEHGAVAFMKTMRREPEQFLTLCDVEVRPEFRGRGLTRAMASAAQLQSGLPIYTSGNCTPEGFERLQSVFELLPWETEFEQAYRSMYFVEDWNDMWPKYPTSSSVHSTEFYVVSN